MSLEFTPGRLNRPISPTLPPRLRPSAGALIFADDAGMERDWRAAFRLLRGLASSRSPLLADPQSLADHLYAHWFHALAGEIVRDYPQSGAFAVATESMFDFEPATVIAIEPSAVEVETARAQRFRVSFGDLIAEPAWSTLAAGTGVYVRARTHSAHGGFWHLWSRAWQGHPPERIERLYLGIDQGAETAVAAQVARHAPQTQTWYAKFLCGSHPHGRRDTALLYLPLQSTRPAWLLNLLDACAPHLRETPVRCTRRLRRGVCSAIDPGNGMSFGQHLCQAVSMASSEAGALSSYARFRHPLAAFMAEHASAQRFSA